MQFDKSQKRRQMMLSVTNKPGKWKIDYNEIPFYTYQI